MICPKCQSMYLSDQMLQFKLKWWPFPHLTKVSWLRCKDCGYVFKEGEL